MSKDTRSTILGIVVACAIQGLTYSQEGVDLTSPLWWAGLIGSWVSIIKGYYHNKAEQPVPAPAPKEEP